MSLKTDHLILKNSDLRVRLRREVNNAPPGTWNTEERYCNNDSMDSGIAGLKDPHFNSNKNSDSETSEYIVDPSTRTTYLKGKFLGKGGFARVHELIDLTTNTVYAGKIIPKNRITKRHHMQKIAREILIHQNLVHRNVVRLHHFFEDTVNAYIILENCSRKSLVHVLKHRNVITEPEVRYYLCQLVAGVSYIHSQHVIHRDLKPGNMFLGEDMVVKIGDFGLATQVDGDKRVTICGTPNYIAPEVLNKLSYSYEADVWAIGCIMYAMLVGQPPFETATLKETYARIVGNKYALPPLASEPARSLICELLQPKPEDRPKLDEICKHEFFTSGYMPESLSPSCCYTMPKFASVALLSRPPQPQSQIICQAPILSQDLKSLTNSVSTLKIPTQKSPNTIAKFSPKDKAACSSPSAGSIIASIRKDRDARQSSLKQKLSSVLCPDKMTLCRKRPNNAVTLYRFLSDCFNKMPPAKPSGSDPSGNPPRVSSVSPLFVSKWIDYSNKYGFGFQLSDKSVGVLFNDTTRMSFTPDRNRVEFHDMHGKVTAHPHNSVPAPLHERLALLQYFTEYMDEHLTEGGDIKHQSQVAAANRHKSTVPHMKRWVRTNTAIIMELCNGTLQINFFKDHTKVIISAEKHGYMVTYINGERLSCSYWLAHISQFSCETNIYDRLWFATAVAREFAELDGEEV
ncbi:serine/threonine-protein kinase PLK1-like [Zootermopsis nevadensis]|uniref:serine/threonine-protein kinase PLK1-like n=1 Tax=Zootermopsis nevadensis TaxID=136037 RepID=UPI000B8EBE46|nr:serine/threonine-protein kinase PLK1-like [Zootermopsis nevadensis]